MLVIADQPAVRIGGERGFAGAGEAEEQRRLAVCADVRRAVHGEDVALRQQKIHHAEDGFLHFAGILGAADENDLAREVGEDEGRGAGAIAFGNGLKFRRGDDGELGSVRSQLLGSRPHKKLLHEQRVPGVLRHDGDRQPIVRIGARVQVQHVAVALLHVPLHPLQQRGKAIRRKGLVHLAPVDARFSERIPDQKLVARRTAGPRARQCNNRAVGRKARFTARDRRFHQLRRRQIPVDMRSL